MDYPGPGGMELTQTMTGSRTGMGDRGLWGMRNEMDLF